MTAVVPAPSERQQLISRVEAGCKRVRAVLPLQLADAVVQELRWLLNNAWTGQNARIDRMLDEIDALPERAG